MRLNFILTSAKCIYKRSPSSFKVAVGTIFIDGGYTYDVAKVIVHPGFENSMFQFDIGLVKTKVGFYQSEYVSSINLPVKYDDSGNKTCILSGWGAVLNYGPLARRMKFIEMKVWKHAECLKKMPSIYKTTICGLVDPGKGLCNLDTGGPLICNGAKRELYGIASWGTCGQDYPDVYIRVTEFRSWILSVADTM